KERILLLPRVYIGLGAIKEFSLGRFGLDFFVVVMGGALVAWPPRSFRKKKRKKENLAAVTLTFWLLLLNKNRDNLHNLFVTENTVEGDAQTISLYFIPF
ncbi:hypothetical protein ACJX0J_033303, partial [Zea mays]